MCSDRRRWYRCCARSNVHARALMAVARQRPTVSRAVSRKSTRNGRNHGTRFFSLGKWDDESARTTVCDSKKCCVFHRFSGSIRKIAQTPRERRRRFLELKSRAVGHRPRRVRPADAGGVSGRGVPALRVGCPSKAASQWTPHPRVRSSPCPRHAHHDQGRRVEEHRG